MKSVYRSVYTAFDPYPSHKGSYIHIAKASEVLSSQFGKTLLLTLEKQSRKRIPRTIKHLEFKSEESNYLKKATAYSQWVDQLLEQQHHLKVGHFRDVWGGLPILKRPHITSVFEVNGFPSIELPNRFPEISKDTIEKIRALENQCLAQTDRIICPSETIRKHILSLGINPSKITVIPNGASIFPKASKPRKLPDQYLLYFGALQPWQGVDVLIKSLQYLKDKPDLKLVICSSHKEKHSRRFVKLINKLELQDRVVWKHRLKRRALFPIIQYAAASIAPLTECARNLEQGCSPLKIFESMAGKAPLIASDLPVVQEIVTDGVSAKLVRPDRPAELARAIRVLLDYPDHGHVLAENAYKELVAHYTWDKIDQRLSDFYKNLLTLDFTNHSDHAEVIRD